MLIYGVVNWQHEYLVQHSKEHIAHTKLVLPLFNEARETLKIEHCASFTI